MDPTVASNETPSSGVKKAAPAPFTHDTGPNPWYQSKWFVWTGSTIFFLAFFVIVVYLSITESQPITATPTKPPTSAPVEFTFAPSALNLTTSPAQAPA
jgi:hypothetical protein